MALNSNIQKYCNTNSHVKCLKTRVLSLNFQNNPFQSEIAKPGDVNIFTLAALYITDVQRPIPMKASHREIHLPILPTNGSPAVTVEQLDKYLSSYCKKYHIYMQFRALTVTRP